MAQVTELVTKFDFQGDISPLYDFNTELGSSITLIAGAVTAVYGLTAAFTALALSEYEALDPLVQLSRETGVAIERMQTLGFVASVSGSNLDAVTSSIIGLEQKIGEASIKGSEDFARLGISVRDMNGNIKSADRVLDEIGQRFRALGLSLSQQRAFAAALGIDSSLLQLLNRTGAELSELEQRARDFGIVTKEQGDALAATNDAITTNKFALQGLRQQIVLGVAPDIRELTDSFTDLILENGEWVKAIAENTIQVVKSLTEALGRLAPILSVVAAGFVAAKIAGMGFAGVMAIIESPIIIWTAAIVAGLLILDDLIVAFRGGKSVIADFFQEFLGIDIVPILHGMVDGAKLLLNSLVASFKWWVNFFKQIYNDVKIFVDMIGDVVSDVAQFFGFGDNADINVNGSIAAAGGGSVQNNMRVEQSNQITIQATNADEARVGVEQALQTQIRDAEDVMRRGQ